MRIPEHVPNPEQQWEEAIEHNLSKFDKELERIASQHTNYDFGQNIYGVVDNKNGKIAELMMEYDDSRANFMLTGRYLRGKLKPIQGMQLPTFRLTHITGAHRVEGLFDDVPDNELSNLAREVIDTTIKIWNTRRDLTEE